MSKHTVLNKTDIAKAASGNFWIVYSLFNIFSN